MDVVRIQDLHFAYSGEEREALQGVNLTLEEGKFYILWGESGCGKSTLLRHMKSVLSPRGTMSGSLWKGVAEEEIGFVFQHPDNQIVTDRVWHELAFGMESLGYPQSTMQLRVAELATCFGMEGWMDREVSQLSGGEKQLLNLAAVLALHPKLLLLDEPMAWLDPLASAEFLSTLYRIQQEQGMTVLLSAHRLEDVISLCDGLFLMEEGRITGEGDPGAVAELLRERGAEKASGLTVPMEIYLRWGGQGQCPYTIAQGRDWLRREMGRISQEEKERGAGGEGIPALEKDQNAAGHILRGEHLRFRYPGGSRDVLQDVSLQVCRGEIVAVLGGNGSGKSTLLRVLCGLSPAGRGRVRIRRGEKWLPLEKGAGDIALLPQDAASLFTEDTVARELGWDAGKEYVWENWAELFRLEPLMGRHPWDISGGEQQRVALAKVLDTEAPVFLLDEPTRGMDARDKRRLQDALSGLARRGKAIVLVSHDIEFAASCADRVGLFFQGRLEGVLPAGEFFTQNHFYTTAAHRMSRELMPWAVTADDVLRGLADGERGREPAASPERTGEETSGRALEETSQPVLEEMSQPVLEETSRRALEEMSGQALEETPQQVSEKAPCQDGEGLQGQTCRDGEPVRSNIVGRRWFVAGIFLLYPFLLWLGVRVFQDRKYLLISLGMAVYALLPFFCLWERRPPRVQKLVVLSALAAIAVAGRCAFYMFPGIKPMAAVAVVAGASLGVESGFFVGALSMLVSNMMFGQGPWTPWQMLAMGLVGLFAGLLFHRAGFLRAKSWQRRVGLAVYGGLAVLCFYGGIMNPASLLMAAYEVNSQNLLAIYLSGLPMDLLHALTTALLLSAAGVPMLKKLERMKKKYDLD